MKKIKTVQEFFGLYRYINKEALQAFVDGRERNTIKVGLSRIGMGVPNEVFNEICESIKKDGFHKEEPVLIARDFLQKGAHNG